MQVCLLGNDLKLFLNRSISSPLKLTFPILLLRDYFVMLLQVSFDPTLSALTWYYSLRANIYICRRLLEVSAKCIYYHYNLY